MSKLPFYLMPGSWGLKGPSREEAEAAYYLTGYELDAKLAEIRNRDTGPQLERALLRVELVHARISPLAHELALLDIDMPKGGAERDRAALDVRLRYGDLPPYQHDLAIIDIDYPLDGLGRSIALVELEYRHQRIDEYTKDYHIAELRNPDKNKIETLVALLDVDLKHGKITEIAHAKEKATLQEEPWIGVVDQGFDTDKGINGIYFEFDWNDSMIVYLRMNGYTGASDEQVVDQWFADVCRAQGVSPMQPGFDGSVVPFSGRITEVPTSE